MENDLLDKKEKDILSDIKVGDKFCYLGEIVEVYNIRQRENIPVKFYLENNNTDQFAINREDFLKHLKNNSIEKSVNRNLKETKISDINIFSLKDGGMAIRCKIDGEQQSGKRLSKDDLINLTDKTDHKELAMKYFREEMKEQITNTNSLRR